MNARETIPELIGKLGLLFGGFVMITAGGGLVVYGALLMYLAVPGGRDPAALEPLNAAVASLVNVDALSFVALVGTVSFVFELRRNGLQVSDDRLLYERKREMRREKAEENEAWQPPEDERDEKTVYEELREERADDGLVLWADTIVGENPPRVRGEIRNTSRVQYTDVQVTVGFVDRVGDFVDTGVASRKELDSGESWTFEVFGRDADGAVTYKITSPEGERDDGQ